MWCARKIEILLVYLTLSPTLGTSYDILTIRPQIFALWRNVNDSFTASCSSRNDTNILWLNPRNEIINNTNGRIHIEERENNNGKRSLALVLTQLELADHGRYMCALEDGTVKKSFSILINDESFLDQHEKDVIVYGLIDHQVNLTCTAQAEPTANFKWYKEDKEISPSENRFYEENNLSILQLTIYDQSYFGDYLCKASNHLGTVEHVISLKEHPKPKPPANITLRGVNSKTLDIKIVPSNQTEISDLKGFRVQYIPEAVFEKYNKNWHRSSQIDFPYTNEVFLLTHLQPNTNYLVRVASGNIVGFSDFTDEKQFKTGITDPNTNSSNELLVSSFN